MPVKEAQLLSYAYLTNLIALRYGNNIQRAILERQAAP